MNIYPLKIFCLFLILRSSLSPNEIEAADLFISEQHSFNVEIVTDKLNQPWGMVFLPTGEVLVTERPGYLRIISATGVISAPVEGLPAVKKKGQGGLLGIALHLDFENNALVYLSHTAQDKRGYGTEVVRGKLQGNRLVGVETIFKAMKKSRGGRHFGSRLVFAADGSLYISLGDRGNKDYAQDLNDHRGSLIRINADGSIPVNNPFVHKENSRDEIYSFGHRNIQGIARHPLTGKIWTHEHGPQGGDEINIIEAGANYGWPVITYGVNYGIATKIGEGTHKAGMQQPVHKWVPSIAPSGMTFYQGDEFPQWRGDLFVGSLKFGLLVRLEIQAEKVVNEERLLNKQYGRIRDVVEGPDGLLYLLTDDAQGKLLKLSPVTGRQ